ncbi:MAG: sialate O-acetylesterase [bacterium]
MRDIKVICSALLGLACFASVASAGERLARVFGDNMVLQREKPVPIWGWADKGQSVTVGFAGQKKTATAGADGRWCVLLDPLPANKMPAELIVQGATTRVFTNVLVGEVWVMSGQSNMEMELLASQDFQAERVKATYPAIRHLKVMNESASFPADDLPRGDWKFARPDRYEIDPFIPNDKPGGDWTVCAPDTCGNYTAAGYYFARELMRALDVPVGIVNATWGGTKIEQWISADGFRSVPELKALSAKVDAYISTTEEGRKRYHAYFEALKQWLPAAEAAVATGARLPAPVPEPWLSANPRQWLKPTTIFNGMIHPISPYPIRGFLWYQGEGNASENETYVQKMTALIGGWRRLWGQDEAPFYFVQLPGYTLSQRLPQGGDGWASIREAQLKVSQRVPRTGMAVTIDIGDEKSIHPGNKLDVGRRLALLALARTYGKPVADSGPIYRSMKIEGDKIRIGFDHAGKGLFIGEKTATEPPKPVASGTLKWVAIAGADKQWRWAETAVEGSELVVFASGLGSPVAVRFGYTINPQGPWLYNLEGLPASPFRTDNW